jgi:predicted nuclease of restriction endonuclease-like (RecB) superfamily
MGQSLLPAGYGAFLADLKTRIRRAQVKASLAANRGMIELYWDIGKSIVERQRQEGWGKSVVERLAADLQKTFPGIRGFSRQNIWFMRAFYLAWTTSPSNLQQRAGELAGPKLSRPVTVLEGENPPRAVSGLPESILQRPLENLENHQNITQNKDEFTSAPILPRPVGELDGAILPRVVSEIPWGQNIALFHKVKDPIRRLWYAKMTFEHGWSLPILIHNIESRLYESQGQAVTNFKATLPPLQSDLAQQAIKDPYTFDFMTLADDAKERELEQGLVDHIQKFLIELGIGFAFVGRQVHLEVEGEDSYIDLLFYHLRLRCYVVIELKTGQFKPEYAGKMNFYLSAVDDRLRHPDDKPTIGLILCRSKRKLSAEYALRDIRKPIGVAAWQTKLERSLPKRLKSQLPSIADIERELGQSPADAPRPDATKLSTGTSEK